MTTVFCHSGVAGKPKPSLADLAAAIAAGAACGDALDAIEACVCVLEDDPDLNAGYGSCLTSEGTLELDAGIATGGRCGGAANVAIRHPITLARRVLEDTPHVLVTGAGAILLGADLEPLERTTDRQQERWQRARDAGELSVGGFGAPEHVDTVGAVALDPHGVLAAGSSTGGVFGKLPGRVGDAPVCGAGVYATREVAVVGTGVGELFLETLASARVARAIEDGDDPQVACERVIAFMGERDHASAGLLALDADGRSGAAYRGGSWSVYGPDGPVDAARLD